MEDADRSPIDWAWGIVDELERAVGDEGQDSTRLQIALPDSLEECGRVSVALAAVIRKAVDLCVAISPDDATRPIVLRALRQHTLSILTPDSIRSDASVEQQQMTAHYGEGGPVAAAFLWLAAVTDGDFAKAWSLMDDNLRLCRAQAWLWNNRIALRFDQPRLDAAAKELARGNLEHPLWSDFARIEVEQLRETWERFIAAHRRGRLGAASHNRVVGIDLEQVVLADLGDEDQLVFNEPTAIDGLVLLMRHVDSAWRVAGYFGQEPPESGWPPRLE